ncbi:AI-2E family transporter [Rhodoferax sp.]|uniref:AI-2E family transporter n=1 Tax=Rhodoferax sp. TaxID=50421 RepID=UPI002751021C|nr:AI-2E family transporter [Rhodoferax sp.]
MSRQPVSSETIRLVVLGLFVAALGTAVALVLAPFVVSMLWAGILAFASWPLYVLLLRWSGGRAWLTALGMTLLMAAVVVLPTVWLLVLLQADASVLADYLAAEMAAGRLRPPAFVATLPIVGPDLASWLNAMLAEPLLWKTELKELMGKLDTEAWTLLGGVGKNLIKLGFALFTLFFVYLHGLTLLEQARTVLRGLLGERTEGYVDAVGNTTRAVVYGIVLTALVQGAVAGLGYWVAGLPAPATLAAVTVLIALIPFGTPLVWGTAGLWLLFTGQTTAGIGLLLWGLLVVSWVDNIVRPMLLSRASNVPFILALFGVLGGLAAFGLVGLFLGPVILAVALAVWREWL